MTDAREAVLGRIRSALGGGVAEPDVPRGYRGAGGHRGGDVVALFCERVADYKATVRRVAAADLAGAVAAACAERGASRLVTPAGGLAAVPGLGSAGGALPSASAARGLEAAAGAPSGPLAGLDLVADDPPLSPRQLDVLDGVLSGCALAIAETGTIVLDGGERSGRRAITLVPDYHACVVEASGIVASVPDAVAALAGAAAAGRPITLVSGPSATSDIELDRVEGVHGPRTLDVFVSE